MDTCQDMSEGESLINSDTVAQELRMSSLLSDVDQNLRHLWNCKCHQFAFFCECRTKLCSLAFDRVLFSANPFGSTNLYHKPNPTPFFLSVCVMLLATIGLWSLDMNSSRVSCITGCSEMKDKQNLAQT